MDKGEGHSDVQQNISDHADEGISKKGESNGAEGVSEADTMMQSECSETCERGRFNKFCLGRLIIWRRHCLTSLKTILIY